MATTTSALSNALRTVYGPRVTDTVFRNNALFDFPGGGAPAEMSEQPRGLLPVIPSNGGTTYNFPVLTSSFSAESYTETQAPMAAGSDSFQNCALSWLSFRTVVEFTGFALDAARGEADLVNAVDRTVTNAARALRDTINTTLLGTGTNSIQFAISSTQAYGGLARATYTTWQSYQVTTTGALTRSALEDMIEALQDNDRGASLSDLVLLMPWNQITNYRRLAGWSGNAVVQESVQPGGHLDVGYTGFSFDGIPILGIPDLTDTVIVALNRRRSYIVEHRPFTFEEKNHAGDGRLFHLTWRGVLVVEEPHLCGKLAGVTS